MWRANQIYTLPNKDIIAFFKSYDSLKNRLFLINDLEGIRSDYTRSFMLSDNDCINKHMWHSLPKGGLLAIAPVLYKTGYDDFDEDDLFLKSNYSENINARWNEFEGDLPDVLNSLHQKTHIPILHYTCEMWGGDIEEESAIVFNKGNFIYKFDADGNKSYQLKDDSAIEIDTTPLQKGFEHLGLHLPTWFFALHEGSFNWKRYWII